MDKQSVIKQVNHILIEDFELEPNSIKPEANLRDELGLDSLDGVDLVVALEKTFQVKIDEIEAREIDTVEKIYAQIIKKTQN
ncbi:acyl carrier protein [bacterium]|nr:acyl carrier protein [bacterium]